MGSSEFPWEGQHEPAPSSGSDRAAGRDTAEQTPEELKEENRKIRRLQMVVNMVMQVIAQDSALTVEEASEMVADTRRVAE